MSEKPPAPGLVLFALGLMCGLAIGWAFHEADARLEAAMREQNATGDVLTVKGNVTVQQRYNGTIIVTVEPSE